MRKKTKRSPTVSWQKWEETLVPGAELERFLAAHRPPELETIMKLLRVMLLELSLQATSAPELLKLVIQLSKPLLTWAHLEERRKEREFAERKYREQIAAQKVARTKAADEASGENALSPQTLEKIERELKLF